MDRLLLAISTFFFLFGFAYTMHALGARVYQRSRLNLFMLLAGFGFQTAFLYLRGTAIGRCPLTNLFELLIFFCWSTVLFYLLIGPAYRLSLLGAFTSPLVFVIQMIALMLPDPPATTARRAADNPWLEAHAALSVMAYGAFALACVAGVMYLIQERQLKTHQIHSIFYRLPPIHDLAFANLGLIATGFALFTFGLVAGIVHGRAHITLLLIVAGATWLIYGAIVAASIWRCISPKRIAVLSVAAFSVMLLTFWGVQAVPSRG